MGRLRLVILLLLLCCAFSAIKADIVQRKIVSSLTDELKQQLTAGDISECHQCLDSLASAPAPAPTIL